MRALGPDATGRALANACAPSFTRHPHWTKEAVKLRGVFTVQDATEDGEESAAAKATKAYEVGVEAWVRYKITAL